MTPVTSRAQGLVKRISLVILPLVALTGSASADLVINEIFYDPPGSDAGNEWIELMNAGDQNFDTTGLWLCVEPAYYGLPARVIPPGAYFLIRWNTSGTNSTTEVFTGSTGRQLESDDSVALYTTNAFDDPDAIFDFIQWGAQNQPRSDVADEAGIWDRFAFIGGAPEGQSLSLIPDGMDQNSPAGWSVTEPTPGTGSVIPVVQETWGRIKVASSGE